MGERLEAVEKPGEDILFRKVINQILNSPFIRGLNRTEEYGCSFLISPVSFIFFGIEDHRQGLIPINISLIFRRFQKLRAEVGMRYINQHHRPVADGFPVHISNSVFRHHIMNIPPRYDHTATRRKIRHDSGNLSVIRRRRQHHDRLAASGQGRPAHKVHLPADAAVKFKTQGIGTYLSGQIDSERGIDGNHLVILGNHIGIIDILAGAKFKQADCYAHSRTISLCPCRRTILSFPDAEISFCS